MSLLLQTARRLCRRIFRLRLAVVRMAAEMMQAELKKIMRWTDPSR